METINLSQAEEKAISNLFVETKISEPKLTNLELIEKKLFNVSVKPLCYQANGLNIEIPNNSAIIREDKPANPFGLVTDRFAPIQPIDIFKGLVKGLTDNKISTDRLTYHESFGGSKIRFRAPLKTIQFINLKGEQDVTEMFLNVETGFDGKTVQKIFIDCFRLVCANGLRMVTTEVSAKFRNTKNNQGRLNSLISETFTLLKDSNEIEDFYKMLNKKTITEKMRKSFITQTLIETGYKYNEGLDEFSNKIQPLIDLINADIEKEIQDTGANVFALLNGVTRYNQHTASTNKMERDEYLNYGVGNKMNASAIQVAKQLILV